MISDTIMNTPKPIVRKTGIRRLMGSVALVMILTQCSTEGVETSQPAQTGANRAASAPLVVPGSTQDFVLHVAPTPQLTESHDAYPALQPNAIKVAGDSPVSTFGADVDRASYTIVRKHLFEHGRLPPADAVRTEEIVNAFRYDYDPPVEGDDRFRPSIALFDAPWSETSKILRVGIKAKPVSAESRPPANIVFLVDVSGSMQSRDKLPLVKKSLRMFLDQLNWNDTVALAVYAGAAGTVLEPTKVRDKGKILRAINQLEAGGSTAGGAGLRLAYQLADRSSRDGAINRVILATDGDFNVGISDVKQLRDLVVKKRDSGVYLSVLGFGLGNYKDSVMQAIAQNGNGIAAYIDNIGEARRVLVEDFLSSLVTVAQDVKFQIEFNPARVASYRLIGYETRLLERADFNNDRVDSGDVGAGSTVTALYELTMVGDPGSVDPLRYGNKKAVNLEDEIAFLKIRYKKPGEDRSNLIERPIVDADRVDIDAPVSGDAKVAAAAAWFAERLRNSPHVEGDWQSISDYVSQLSRENSSEDSHELVRLVNAAQSLSQYGG